MLLNFNKNIQVYENYQQVIEIELKFIRLTFKFEIIFKYKDHFFLASIFLA